MNYLVNTPCGPVQGCAGRLPGTAAYKGIRYATAGRWEYPVQVTHWDGVYDAAQYGHCCYQPRAFYDEELNQKKYFYYNEFRKGETYTYSEDCLFLNVFAPDTATPESRLPVLFYIHGGGYTGGCGHEKHFDGPVWPQKGVIAVTINYRLGPLGFVCLPDLAAEAGHTGNYGLYDQLCALQWVRANIAAFGGDADRITVMGQSAGAMSVQQHCLSPLSKDLFAGAVMSSGGGVNKMMAAKPAESMYSFWQQVMQLAGCADLAAFRALPVETLFEVWQKAKKQVKGGAMSSSPVMDGAFIPQPADAVVAAGEQAHVPYLIGSTSEDVMPPFLYSMAKGWCRTQAEQNGPAAWCWFFDRKLPGDGNGAWHSSDLWYWFGTLENSWRPFAEKDRLLSEEMVQYLTNFVKTGDPNGGGLTRWLPLDQKQGKALRLGEGETRMGSVSMAKLALTMVTNKAVGE